MFQAKMLLIQTKEITSKKGEKYKMFTLVNTEKYSKLQLLGSNELPTLPNHSEVEVTAEITPRQVGYGVFVHAIKLV